MLTINYNIKKRHYGHKTSFENRKYEHATALSTYIWKLKDASNTIVINLSQKIIVPTTNS